MTKQVRIRYRIRNWAKYNRSLINRGNLHVVVDSSGLKVFGEGEWKVRQHGYTKRRTWRKIHFAVDSETHEIIGCALSSSGVHDSEVLADILSEDEDIDSVYGDGAYDSLRCYLDIDRLGAKAIIPPRSGACLWKASGRNPAAEMRNRNVRGLWKHGRKEWKKNTGYHRRSLAETAVFRFKSIFGADLRSRKFENQAAEVFIKVKALNKMTDLGMPVTVRN